MNVTASPCFPLLWFCLSKLPFCTRESNEGGTQASLFLNTGSVTVLQCYTQGSLFLNTAALLFTSEAHFPLWDETGDSPKLRIWEQLAGATPPYLPTHPHTPNRFAPIWVTDNKWGQNNISWSPNQEMLGHRWSLICIIILRLFYIFGDFSSVMPLSPWEFHISPKKYRPPLFKCCSSPQYNFPQVRRQWLGLNCSVEESTTCLPCL